MLLIAALALAQSPYSPEIESILRRRDEARERSAQEEMVRTQEARDLAAVIPPVMAKPLAACLAEADRDAAAGLAQAERWAAQDGGAYAAQCRGYALGRAGQWAQATSAFESGAIMPGLDAAGQARLWAQAGNAAMVGGDGPRALQAFDRALALPLPQTLTTGEVRLDRARARVAAGDLPGARSDLDVAVQLAAADPLAWLLSATLARRMDDLPLAQAHIEAAAKRARDDAAVALEQGVIYALSGDRDAAARAAFERAQALAKGSEIAAKATAYLAQLDALAAAAKGPDAPPEK